MYDAELARLLLVIVGAMVVIAFVQRWVALKLSSTGSPCEAARAHSSNTLELVNDGNLTQPER